MRSETLIAALRARKFVRKGRTAICLTADETAYELAPFSRSKAKISTHTSKKALHEAKTKIRFVIHNCAVASPCSGIEQCADSTESAAGANAANWYCTKHIWFASESAVTFGARHRNASDLEASGGACDKEQSADLRRPFARSRFAASHARGKVEPVAHGH